VKEGGREVDRITGKRLGPDGDYLGGSLQWTWCSRAGVRKSLWAAQWRSTNRRDGPTTHLLAGNWLTPALFPTRGAARAWIEVHYGYIRSRPDLRSEPHGWRMPRAVRVRLTVRAE
jgi:hypothetical protein